MADRVLIASNSNPMYGAGVNVTLTAASADKHYFPNTGRERLLVINTDSSAHAVTITSVPDYAGRTGDATKTTAAIDTAKPGVSWFGPFDPMLWNQSTGVVNCEVAAATGMYLAIVKDI